VFWGGDVDVQLWPTSLFGFISLTSLVIYGFEGIGLVLPVENASEDKKAFPWLFIGALAFVTCVYVAVGAVGTFITAIKCIIHLYSPNMSV
jgi:hypothetical protein